MILKQIIPIDNWWALFKKENGDLGVNRLACLVMISDVGGDYVVGMVGTRRKNFIIANKQPNFQCYVYAKEEDLTDVIERYKSSQCTNKEINN